MRNLIAYIALTLIAGLMIWQLCQNPVDSVKARIESRTNHINNIINELEGGN